MTPRLGFINACTTALACTLAYLLAAKCHADTLAALMLALARQIG